ncbi:SgcJ/EcaC family oxidoreductase [Synoicihabitans lomoniglobus]|uniref:SgcJ/EcaC family oxidoreductase n=1 Tax=Synoicihabitans lomoniglobus TaxID=2909285 RepID=A0AAE9ZVV1_9BACT|nr:SgcJ/EcaC family oxidoreductase [Opitutaceae bacterium LMO-M01]WED65146.1 SgcJ/EcaC family oxidoreductase [Opitutaceae bacterium LMO-M01]
MKRKTLFFIAILLTPPFARAETTVADIEAVTASWAAAYNTRDPDNVVRLYAPDAVFWGTVSPTLRDTPEEVRDYFKGMPERPLARVEIGDHRVQIFGDIATNTGFYTFSNTDENGMKSSLASRFSFTYHQRDGHWFIVMHHSSRVPQ